jgi:hypothetical protein
VPSERNEESRQAGLLRDRQLVTAMDLVAEDAAFWRGKYTDPERNRTCGLLVLMGRVLDYLRDNPAVDRDRQWFDALHERVLETVDQLRVDTQPKPKTMPVALLELHSTYPPAMRPCCTG